MYLNAEHRSSTQEDCFVQNLRRILVTRASWADERCSAFRYIQKNLLILFTDPTETKTIIIDKKTQKFHFNFYKNKYKRASSPHIPIMVKEKSISHRWHIRLSIAIYVKTRKIEPFRHSSSRLHIKDVKAEQKRKKQL